MRSWCALALAAGVLAGSALADPLEIPLGRQAPPASLAGIEQAPYPVAAAALITVLRDQLALPFPPFIMEVHAQPAQFEAALVQHLKLKPELARSTASFAKAAVGNRRILVNQSAMETLGGKERIVTLAHEMAHASQLELAGHHSLIHHQWLVEGFAEWVALRAVDALAVAPWEAERASAVERVAAARRDKGLAALADCDTFEQWVRMRQRLGFDAAYPYMLLVTEFIIERHGYQRTLDYFRAYRTGSDSAGNFRLAFGEDVPDFQRAVDQRMAQLLR
jgi:hypothetical protein